GEGDAQPRPRSPAARRQPHHVRPPAGAALRRGGRAAHRAGPLDTMVALDPPEIVGVPLADVLAKPKLVPVDSDTVVTARDLGISLGGRRGPSPVYLPS